MFNLRKLVVLLVVSVLSLSGAVQAASGSDGKGSDKHSSSDSKKSSSDKDHKSSDDKDHESINGKNKDASDDDKDQKSISGENKKATDDDKQVFSDGESHPSLKDDGYTPFGGDNKDLWDGKIFSGHDFNPGLGQGGERWNDYSTSSIPEPETYAMLLAGLSLLGFLSRRKKKDV